MCTWTESFHSLTPRTLRATWQCTDQVQQHIPHPSLCSIRPHHLPPESHTEAKQVVHQIAYADRIVLNKMDLVPDSQLPVLQDRLAVINSAATVHITTMSQVQVSDILHIKAFESGDALRVTKARVREKEVAAAQEKQQHEHTCGDGCEHDEDDEHPHDHSITTLVLERGSGIVLDEAAVKFWLADLLWGQEEGNEPVSLLNQPEREAEVREGEMEIFRIKGLLSYAESADQHFLQGVQQLFDIQQGGPWKCGADERSTRIVVIGRSLDREALEAGLERCCRQRVGD